MADITALCERVMVIHQGQLIYNGGLNQLLERFAPCREVKVELGHSLPPEKLADFGEVQTIEGREIRFLIEREDLTSSVGKMLAQLEVIDLSVTEPPIEEVIGQLFDKGIIE